MVDSISLDQLKHLRMDENGSHNISAHNHLPIAYRISGPDFLDARRFSQPSDVRSRILCHKPYTSH
jgi:hypothetical protein